MPDYFPILLAEAAAVELSWGTIAGIVSAVGAAVGAGLKIVWGYWTKREIEKCKAWKEVVDDKDVIISQKDERIEELSKELSRKSDSHAEKIQELMGMTLDKVEGWSEKQERLLDRALTVQAEFTAEVRKLKIDPAS